MAPPVDKNRRISGLRRPAARRVPTRGRPVDLSRRNDGFRRPPVSEERLAAEHGIAALAARQHGRVATEQLRSLGFGQDAIDYRVALGKLHPVHRNVYAVGALDDGATGRWMAATLAGGPCALLSHCSAGGLWDIRPDHRTRADITVPGSARRHRESGVVCHRMRSMHPDDLARVDGIPVTSLPLTLLHLAGWLARPEVERVLVRAARKKEFDLDLALALCARSHGRPGVRLLREIINRDLSSELRTLSELEVRFLQLCRRYGITMPDVNRDVESFMVDAMWHAERVIVELDGYEFHELPRDLRRDNARNRRLVVAGYRVVRFVWADLVNDALSTANCVLDLLGLPPFPKPPGRPKPPG